MEEIHILFDKIANKYDLINKIISFGFEIYWKKKLVNILNRYINNKSNILDLASGTGDIIIMILQSNQHFNKIFAVDPSKNMINQFLIKLEKYNLYNNNIFVKVNSLNNINFIDNYFNIINISFGIRNFNNMQYNINEIHRILINNGKLIIMEFSLPNNLYIYNLYLLYINYILPYIGGFISGNIRIYKYLSNTIINFSHDKLVKLLLKNGFIIINKISLTFNIVTIYICKCVKK